MLSLSTMEVLMIRDILFLIAQNWRTGLFFVLCVEIIAIFVALMCGLLLMILQPEKSFLFWFVLNLGANQMVVFWITLKAIRRELDLFRFFRAIWGG